VRANPRRDWRNIHVPEDGIRAIGGYRGGNEAVGAAASDINVDLASVRAFDFNLGM
jgi:hypothetical protein